MVAIKKDLLSIVQDILSDLDSEPVNDLSDTLEAEQIATVVERTFYDIVLQTEDPSNEGLVKLTALSDTSFPTHFQYPDNLKEITCLWYDVSSDDSFEYREITWVDPTEFLSRTDNISSNYDSVLDKEAGTNLRIVNNRQPSFYTSFDNVHVVLDSYKSTVDNTLTEAKTRAMGYTYPVFSRSNTYIPDIGNDLFPLLIQESTARAQDLFKGGVTPKMERAARNSKVTLQSKKYKTKRSNNWLDYGR